MASYLLYLRHISLVALSRSLALCLSFSLSFSFCLSLSLFLSFSCTHSLSLALSVSILLSLSFRCTVLARTLPWIWISRRDSCSRSVHITSHHRDYSFPLPSSPPYHSLLFPFPSHSIPPSYSLSSFLFLPSYFPFTIISSSPFPFPSNLPLNIVYPPATIIDFLIISIHLYSLFYY